MKGEENYMSKYSIDVYSVLKRTTTKICALSVSSSVIVLSCVLSAINFFLHLQILSTDIKVLCSLKQAKSNNMRLCSVSETCFLLYRIPDDGQNPKTQ
jgi:hypothetical protein